MLLPLAPFFIAFASAAVLTPIVRAAAGRIGAVALPSADRWHRRRIPLLGGVAMYAAAGIALLLSGARDAETLLIAGGATCMFALGLIDDFFPLRPTTKLLGQVVVACAFTLAAGPTNWIEQPALDALLTIGWFVAVSNAFNLLDNMDGLCAGVSAIAALAFCIGVGADTGLVRLGAALAGAAAGFLLYNRYPARIFMGDCGSLWLGSTLGMLTLRVEHRHTVGVVSAMVFPVLLMLIPIFDTAFVTVTRKLSARSASTGGRDHTSHRLVALGFPESTAVLLLYGFAAVAGATAVLLTHGARDEALLLAGVLVVGLVLLAARLARVKVYGDEDFILLRSRPITPLLIDVTYKRRIFEVLLDFVLVSVAYYGAYVLRFDGEMYKYYGLFVQSLPAVIACQLGGLYAAGVYQGIWRHISVYDVWTFGRGLLYGALSSVLVLVYLYRFEGYSRGVFVIDTLLAAMLVIGSRVAFRGLGELADRYREGGRRTAVYGAGDAGSLLVRELRSHAALDCRPVMFVDDNAVTHGRRILGVPIIGGEASLEAALAAGSVQVVALAVRLPADRMSRVAALCRTHGAELFEWHVGLTPVTDAVPPPVTAPPPSVRLAPDFRLH